MKSLKKRSRNEFPKLDMTPMIDVVFQLLIFFVVTLKQEDIFAKLTAARPMGMPIEVPVELIDIRVDRQGFALNGKTLTQEALDRQIGRLSMFSKKSAIVIKCQADSPHGSLVQALDICTKHEMTNLSIFSK